MSELAPSPTGAPAPSPTRERVLDAAEALFAERGYAGASVRAIAEAAGLRPASLYSHFEGKQALYEAVLERGLGPVFELLEAAAARELSTPGGEALVESLVDRLARTPHVPRLVVHEAVSGGAHLARVARRWMRPLVAQALATVKRSPLPSDWSEEEVPHLIAAWLQLLFGPFALAPLLAEVFDEDPLSPAALARQKAFLRRLARRLAQPPAEPAEEPA